MWESIGHWFLINFERVWAGRGTKNSRALFAYPAVGCIISFQLHFRFELIKKCNFRLVVFSIECRLPSPSPFPCKCAPGQFSPFELNRVEPLLKVAMTFRSTQVGLIGRCPSEPIYEMYIYVYRAEPGRLSGIVINRHIDPCSGSGNGRSRGRGVAWTVELATLGRLLTLLQCCCNLFAAQKKRGLVKAVKS